MGIVVKPRALLWHPTFMAMHSVCVGERERERVTLKPQLSLSFIELESEACLLYHKFT